jgi:hypothetical protein
MVPGARRPGRVLVLALTLASCGGSLTRVEFSDPEHLPGPYNYTERSIWGVKDWFRQSLEGIHMEPADVDCFIIELEKSSWLTTNPPSVDLPEAGFAQIARRCAIDVSKLYFEANFN